MPATRGMAQAQAEEGDREPQKTERSGDSKIIPECPAMSGTTWEARLFLLRYGLSRRRGERGHCLPLGYLPPPFPPSPPLANPPAEVQR